MTQRERGREKSLVSLAPEHKQAQQAILPGIQFSLSVCVLFDSWFARSFSRPAGSLTRSFIPSFACFFCVRVLRDLVRRLCSFGPFGCFVHIYAFFWGGGRRVWPSSLRELLRLPRYELQSCFLSLPCFLPSSLQPTFCGLQRKRQARSDDSSCMAMSLAILPLSSFLKETAQPRLSLQFYFGYY